MIFFLGCAAPMAGRKNDGEVTAVLKVGTFTSGKKVIPLFYDMGKLHLANIKMPDLVATNGSERLVTLQQIIVVGRAGANEAVRYTFDGDALSNIVGEAGIKLNKALADPANDDGLKIGLGAVSTRGPFVEGLTLKPGEVAVFRLSRLSFIEYTGPASLTALDIKIVGNTEVPTPAFGEISFELDAHASKAEYVFPLAKTNVMLANLPLNLTQHRQQHSQEFAFDIVGMGMDKSGVLNTSNGAPTKLSDYIIYHKDIVAIGDGVVVEVAEGFPESRMGNPKEYTEAFFETLLKELVPKIGFKNALCGNYIIIDHGNGEYSAYMHVSEGTIKKKVGDHVTAGEAIAKVGNTGHSTEPHLHFQVMDAQDFLVANGLPVMFRNVKPQEMNQNISASNSLLFSDYLLFNELAGE